MELQAHVPLKVLLADDDSDDSLLFNEALEQAKLPVQLMRAENGNEVLSLLQSSQMPDLVFLDVNMPLMNGIECLENIRSDQRFKDLPIVIYSTTNYKINIEACFRGGANVYIIKPNSFNDIIKMVKKLCTKEWTSTVTHPTPEYFVMSTFE